MRSAAAEAKATSSSRSSSLNGRGRRLALSTIMPRQPSASSRGAATMLRAPETTMLSEAEKRASRLASTTSAASFFSVTSCASRREYR